MIFSSIDFIFRFLPIFLIGYYIAPKNYKNLILFIGSLIFYAWGDKTYLPLLLFSLLVNFIFGKLIAGHGQPHQTEKTRKIFLLITLVFNFGMLIFFKYTNFLIENINVLLSGFGAEIPVAKIKMPLAISFYTFQIVAYIVDVYRREYKPANNIVTLGTYLFMFPHLVSGPIFEYQEIAPELRYRNVTIENLEKGLKTFILGFGAKVILANPMGTLWAGMSRYGYESISMPYAWLGAFGYSFQIYFDFFGYSLMAMGLGQMLGITIPKNFDNPYISRNMSEFWRRWHMTLGRWFKKYIYFPLGGSRCSTPKIIRNTLIVWAFTGLWHGASWNFVLWGLIFFGLLTLERYWLGQYLERFPVLGHVYVCLLIPLTWVVFAMTDMGDLGTYFLRLFPFAGSPDFVTTKDFFGALVDYWYLLIACVFFSTQLPEKLYMKYREKWEGHAVLAYAEPAVLLVIFIVSMVLTRSSSDNPFLYFGF
ncbi:MAG: MBOAT family protein [Ruminococcus sp.]|nr:MBOAT family protein [Ruminococcus sp.]